MRRFLIGLAAVAIAVVGPLAADGVTFCQLQGGATDALRITNLSSGAPPSEVILGAQVGRVALSPDRRHAYARIAGGLKVIDVDRLRPIDTLAVPGTGGPFVVAPDGTLYSVESTDSGAVIRSIDPRGAAGDSAAIALPDEVRRVLDVSIGSGGRLLYVETSSQEFEHIVYIIELPDGVIIARSIVPADAYFSIGVQASPSDDFAYLLQRNTPDGGAGSGNAWLIRSDAEPRRLDFGELDYGNRLGWTEFPPDGPLAYLVRSGTPGVGDRTLVIDTRTHTVIDTLPSGAIAGFDGPDCVVVTGGRLPRRACPGDDDSTPIERNGLLPASVVPVGINTFWPTVWTAGDCAAPAVPCSADGACLVVEGARGAPGDTVDVGVRLRARGHMVAGVQNDLFADTALPVAATPLGHDGELRATCHANPEIDKPQSAFGCNEPNFGGCLSVRALILSFADLAPIADGSLLYTCAVHVPNDTPAGRYRLACGYAGASDADGVPLPIHCEEAEIVVAVPREGSAGQSAPDTASGCQLTPAASSRAAWPIPLAVLAVGLLRRRRRRAR